MSDNTIVDHAEAVPEIRQENKSLLVSGSIVFDTVVALREQGDDLIQTQETLCFDFREVSRTDSSAIALLIAWLHQAKALNKTIRFINLPQSMLYMAQAFDIKNFLPL